MSNVDHPKHYNSHPSGVECITVVEHMSFNVGNAMKYLWRADEKGAPIEDLQKAAWYLQREIDLRQDQARTEAFIPAAVQPYPKEAADMAVANPDGSISYSHG